jgi:hypothetical protein
MSALSESVLASKLPHPANKLVARAIATIDFFIDSFSFVVNIIVMVIIVKQLVCLFLLF